MMICFNKMAITKQHNKYLVTVLLESKLKKRIKQLKDTMRVLIEMDAELMSSSYVSTQLKLRGEFQQSPQDNLKNLFEIKENQQKCLLRDTIVYSQEDVHTRMNSQ